MCSVCSSPAGSARFVEASQRDSWVPRSRLPPRDSWQLDSCVPALPGGQRGREPTPRAPSPVRKTGCSRWLAEGCAGHEVFGVTAPPPALAGLSARGEAAPDSAGTGRGRSRAGMGLEPERPAPRPAPRLPLLRRASLSWAHSLRSSPGASHEQVQRPLLVRGAGPSRVQGWPWPGFGLPDENRPCLACSAAQPRG